MERFTKLIESLHDKGIEHAQKAKNYFKPYYSTSLGYIFPVVAPFLSGYTWCALMFVVLDNYTTLSEPIKSVIFVAGVIAYSLYIIIDRAFTEEYLENLYKKDVSDKIESELLDALTSTNIHNIKYKGRLFFEYVPSNLNNKTGYIAISRWNEQGFYEVRINGKSLTITREELGKDTVSSLISNFIKENTK